MKRLLNLFFILIMFSGCSNSAIIYQVAPSNIVLNNANQFSFYKNIYNLNTENPDLFVYDAVFYKDSYFLSCNTNPTYLLKIDQEGNLKTTHSISINNNLQDNVSEKTFFYHTIKNLYLVVCTQKIINLKTSSCLFFLPIESNSGKVEIDHAISFYYPNLIISIDKTFINGNNLTIGGSYYINKFYDELSNKNFISQFYEKNGIIIQKFFSVLLDPEYGDTFQTLLSDDEGNVFFIVEDNASCKTSKTKLCKMDGEGNVKYIKQLPNELRYNNHMFYLNKQYIIVNSGYFTKFDQEGALFDSKKLSLGFDFVHYFVSPSGLIGFSGYKKAEKESIIIISLSNDGKLIDIKSTTSFIKIPSKVVYTNDYFFSVAWNKADAESDIFGIIMKDVIDQNHWKLPLSNFTKKIPKQKDINLKTEEKYLTEKLRDLHTNNYYKIQKEDYMCFMKVKNEIIQVDTINMINIQTQDLN